jgi:hypothetical protein
VYPNKEGLNSDPGLRPTHETQRPGNTRDFPPKATRNKRLRWTVREMPAKATPS